MTRTRFVLLLLSLLAMMPTAAHAQLWSGIIQPSRATDWSQAGLPGDEPPDATWAQCGPTIAAYGTSAAPASPATINNALYGTGPGYTGCPSPRVIMLGAGDFYLNGGIDFQSYPNPANNTVLRGQGANQTRLHFSNFGGCNGWHANICIEGSNTYPSGPTTYTEADWTAGYGQNATTITLSTVAGLVPNLTPIVLDGCDTGYAGTLGNPTCTGAPVDNGGIYVCQFGAVCNTGAAANTTRTNRGEEEVHIVTAISGSGPYTVTISPALHNPNWGSISAPQAWWGSLTITNSGVENLLVDTSADASASSIQIITCYKCWVMGVASNNSNNYHIKSYISSHTLIRDNYIYLTQNKGTQSYGIGGGINGDALFENNIAQGVVDPFSFDASCTGCVMAYNFSVNDWNATTAYLWALIDYHAAGEYNILNEGNIGSTIDLDTVHSTQALVTLYRNYMNGYQATNGVLPTNNTTPIHWGGIARYMNAVGNVLGTLGYIGSGTPYTGYQCIPSAALTPGCLTADFYAPWNIGFSGNTFGLVDSDTPPSPNDTLALATEMRWGNYDVVTAATRWCGNSSDTGWSSTCGGASEIPTSIKQNVGYTVLLGTGNGSTTTFSGTAMNTPIIPGNNFVFSGGESNGVMGYDSGSGTFTGSGGSNPVASGTINYSTGAVSVTFAAPPASGAPITLNYIQKTGGTDPYANAVPTVGDTGAGQGALPASLVYSSKPGWWPSNKAWPIIGPDVTAGNIGQCAGGAHNWSLALSSSQCAGGSFTPALVAGHAVSNPAMDCYLNTMGGPADGTGNMLTFNAASCYTNSVSGQGQSGNQSQPSPPTDLIATVD